MFEHICSQRRRRKSTSGKGLPEGRESAASSCAVYAQRSMMINDVAANRLDHMESTDGENGGEGARRYR